MRKKEDFVDEAYKTIGLNVKKLREAKNFTQLELSLAMGHKSVSIVSCAEIYHKKQHFNLEHLLKISKILEVDLCEFFKGVRI